MRDRVHSFLAKQLTDKITCGGLDQVHQVAGHDVTVLFHKTRDRIIDFACVVSDCECGSIIPHGEIASWQNYCSAGYRDCIVLVLVLKSPAQALQQLHVCPPTA